MAKSSSLAAATTAGLLWTRVSATIQFQMSGLQSLPCSAKGFPLLKIDMLTQFFYLFTDIIVALLSSEIICMQLAEAQQILFSAKVFLFRTVNATVFRKTNGRKFSHFQQHEVGDCLLKIRKIFFYKRFVFK
jgi:hypothetical protein